MASPSRRYCAKIEMFEGEWGIRSTISLSKGCGPRARRVYRDLTVNALVPRAVVVANDGTVVTLDEAAPGMRSGPLLKHHDLVVYSPAGKVLRASRLEDLLAPLGFGKRELSPENWRYQVEPPWVLADRVEVTTNGGDLLIVDLATGAVRRGEGRFVHLRQLLAGDLAQLARVEYQGRKGAREVRCIWRSEQTDCQRSTGAETATRIGLRPVPRSELRGKLGAIEQVLPALRADPVPCRILAYGDRMPAEIDWNGSHGGCGTVGVAVPSRQVSVPDQGCCFMRAQRLRLVFARPEGEMLYDFAVELDGHRQPEAVRQALRALVQVLRFDDDGTLTDAPPVPASPHPGQ